MTEIPEHLLERSRARRAALGLGGGDAAAPAKAATPEGGAAPASAAPAKAAASAPVAAAKKPEVVQSPEVRAANARKKIPWWAAPVLLFLPLWSFLYVQTLSKPGQKAAGALAEGQTVYAKCAGCHGAGGAGAGAIPGFVNGQLLAIFPDAAAQIEWVIKGSDGFKSVGAYGATNRPVAGGMPAWGGQLTATELASVVYYERIQFGGEAAKNAEQLKTAIESKKLPAKFDTAATAADIQKLLDEIAPKAG